MLHKVHATQIIKLGPTDSFPSRKCAASLILNLNTRRRWVVNLTPWLLYPGREPWFPRNRNRVGTRASLDIF